MICFFYHTFYSVFTVSDFLDVQGRKMLFGGAKVVRGQRSFGGYKGFAASRKFLREFLRVWVDGWCVCVGGGPLVFRIFYRFPGLKKRMAVYRMRGGLFRPNFLRVA